MWFSAVLLTIVGMAVTFLFLIIMVLAITLAGKIINQYFPELPQVSEDTEKITAVIAAALQSRRTA